LSSLGVNGKYCAYGCSFMIDSRVRKREVRFWLRIQPVSADQGINDLTRGRQIKSRLKHVSPQPRCYRSIDASSAGDRPGNLFHQNLRARRREAVSASRDADDASRVGERNRKHR
jgi:hypothetical protein